MRRRFLCLKSPSEGVEIRKPKSSEAAKKAKLLSTSKGDVLDYLELTGSWDEILIPHQKSLGVGGWVCESFIDSDLSLQSI